MTRLLNGHAPRLPSFSITPQSAAATGLSGSLVIQVFYNLNFWGLCWVFNTARRFSLAVGCGGCTPVVQCELLMAVPPLIVKPGLSDSVSALVVCVLSSWTGLVALRHVKSPWSRDGTCVPCTGRQVLNH